MPDQSVEARAIAIAIFCAMCASGRYADAVVWFSLQRAGHVDWVFDAY